MLSSEHNDGSKTITFDLIVELHSNFFKSFQSLFFLEQL